MLKLKSVANYSVTYTSDYFANLSTSNMPWWGNQTLANQFSSAVGTQLAPTTNQGLFLHGPLFGFEFDVNSWIRVCAVEKVSNLNGSIHSDYVCRLNFYRMFTSN